jgi:hypothetical protein
MKKHSIILLTLFTLSQSLYAEDSAKKRVACLMQYSQVGPVKTIFKKIEIPISSCNVKWSKSCRTGKITYPLNQKYQVDIRVQTEDRGSLVDQPRLSLSTNVLHLNNQGTTVIGETFDSDLNSDTRVKSDIVMTTSKFINPEIADQMLKHYGDYHNVSLKKAFEDGVLAGDTLWETRITCYYDRTRDVVELHLPEEYN